MNNQLRIYFIEIIYLQRISQLFQEISLDLALRHIPLQLHLLDRLRHMPHTQYKYQDQYKLDLAPLLYNQLSRHSRIQRLSLPHKDLRLPNPSSITSLTIKDAQRTVDF